MGKNLENKDLYIPDEFPNLEYIVLDVRKTLKHDKITPDNPKYEILLDTAIRTTLLKRKFGVLIPGQPSEEKREWFERIKSALEEQDKSSRSKNWKITSAQRQQWHEENRAGQTYTESGLE